MAGRRGGFFSRLLNEDSSKAPLTDADREQWLRSGPGEMQPSWGPGAPSQPARTAGVDIVEMAPESPLGQAGIQEGDVITAINGRSTPTEASLAYALNQLGPGERAEVSLIRDDSPLTVMVTAPS